MMAYKSIIATDKTFVESNEYQAYEDRIRDVIYNTKKQTSVISVRLPVLVMRDEETWSHKLNYILAYEIGQRKFYTCTLHVDMTSFQKDYNKKKVAESVSFQEWSYHNKIIY